MSNIEVSPSVLSGTIKVPPSKSHTLRALVFGLMAKGTSKIYNYLNSPDTFAMIEAINLLGGKVHVFKDRLEVEGVNGKLEATNQIIDSGNSGQVLRFIGALAGLIPGNTVITGDESIKTRRPVTALIDGLQQLGAKAQSTEIKNQAPILIKGPIVNDSVEIDGSDSQPVSGLIIAAAFADNPIEIFVKNPKEEVWIDLTLYWLDMMKIPYTRKGYTYFRLEGRSQIEAFNYTIPGDASSLAFPLVAAIITQSEITIEGIDLGDVQGDTVIVDILKSMGANISYNDERKEIHVKKTNNLIGIKIDLNPCIDAITILAVTGCFAKGTTELSNAAIARKKESDRIASITCELKKMGADIEERPDGLVIKQSKLQGAAVFGHKDHRMVLSLATAGLASDGKTVISGSEAIKKTYSKFVCDMQNLGAKIRNT